MTDGERNVIWTSIYVLIAEVGQEDKHSAKIMARFMDDVKASWKEIAELKARVEELEAWANDVISKFPITGDCRADVGKLL